ncbi:tetratricopeptide repeat protein [Eisenibacter elegans]|uniref:tetratricopeptide repeat protein n=1 Tax=Eisenibacter elegans TaxID=997 RepID=UPI0009D73847|nr:tetratricopeptide repeat protein [Eisenibacter elegans]
MHMQRIMLFFVCFSFLTLAAQAQEEETMLREGLALINQGKYQESIRKNEEVIKKYPKSHVAFNNIGLAYYYLDEMDKSIDFLKKSIAVNADYGLAHANLSKMLFLEDRYEESLKHANRSIQIGGSQSDLALYVKGRILLDQGNAEAAIEMFKDAIKIDGEYRDAYFWRGYAYVSLQKYEMAILDYDRVVRLDPNHSMTYNNRGYCYMEGPQNYDRAMSDFNKALELDPDNHQAVNNRAFILHEQGKKEEACKEWQRAIKMGNKNAQNLYNDYCN